MLLTVVVPIAQPQQPHRTIPPDNSQNLSLLKEGLSFFFSAEVSGLSYDATSGRYTYAWKTDKTWAGRCRQLIMRFEDGTERKAYFQFTK